MEFKNLNEKELLEIDGGATASAYSSIISNRGGTTITTSGLASGELVANVTTNSVLEKQPGFKIAATSVSSVAVGTPTIIVRPFHHR